MTGASKPSSSIKVMLLCLLCMVHTLSVTSTRYLIHKTFSYNSSFWPDTQFLSDPESNPFRLKQITSLVGYSLWHFYVMIHLKLASLNLLFINITLLVYHWTHLHTTDLTTLLSTTGNHP